MADSKQNRPGFLIIDHGTRNEEARETFSRFVAALANARPDWLVELVEPGFVAGIDALVARGATQIFVHLHFLGAGYHVRESIPELVAEVSQRHASISIKIGEPLGHDPRIVDLVLDRMEDQMNDRLVYSPPDSPPEASQSSKE